MIKLTDMVFIATWMALSTKATGRKISNTERVWRRGPMAPDTRAFMFKARSTEKESFCGLMEVPITVSSSKTTFKAKENIIGPMGVSMMVSGTIIKWKATVFLRGRTEDFTRAPTSMTKRKVKATSTGPTVVSTKAAGKTVSSMASARTHQQVARPSKESGPMAKDYTGSRALKDNEHKDSNKFNILFNDKR